jgi:homoserine dehydrogenase
LYYVRFTVKDRPSIIAELVTIFGRHAINIDSVLQRPGYPKDKLPCVITFEPCSGNTMAKALDEIAKLDFLVQPPLGLPMLK